MQASARWRARRKAGAYALPPTPGRNVGRAISPAAELGGVAGVPGRCKHRPLRMRGQGPAGLCRIFPSQTGNAPLRLRLAAQPPSGLRCPHRTARAEARLCSATAKPAPSRFLRRRRRSTPQPLAGEPFKRQTPKSLPCKGRWMRRKAQTEGCIAAWRQKCPAKPGRTLPCLRRGRCLHRPGTLAMPQGPAAGEIARPTLRP